MTRDVRLYLVGSLVLVLLAGCGRNFFAQRESWRREAEVQCLKSGSVKPGPAVALRLSTDRDTVTAASGDVALIRFSIVDSSGSVVPTADNVVRFNVSGGRVVALDNADLQDHDPYQSAGRHAFNGRGLAILRPAGRGAMRITAAADGLKEATMTITVP